MTSIQERLQLKRVPMDAWSVREQLCLASAVVRSGDQNWMSVSRALKTVGEPNRPPDWYSQKSCAAQYGTLLEHVETPKRKKRSSEDPVETPQESIVKRLTQDRISEIQKTIADMNQQYEQLKTEISEVRNQTTSEDRLREIWSSIETAKRTQERENARRAALLKEREERRARAAHNARTSVSNEPPSPSGPTTPSSPLLTSLLKSSPVVTTPQHMSHPASVVDTMSPSVTAPTLSMLLEKSSPQQDSKRAAIEHIKSQLVQIEQQLKANTPPSPAPLAAPPAPSLDIDDIEINAEDVYVFRDVDIHIPNVPSHDKPVDKTITPKKEPETIEIEVEPATAVEEPNMNIAKEEPILIEDIKEEVPIDVESVPMEETTAQRITEETVDTEMVDIKIAFPEVKFPTTEIKVIQAEEQQIKEEVNDPGTSQEENTEETVVIEDEVVVHDEEIDSVEKQISNLHAEPVVSPHLQIPLPPQSPQPPQLPEPQLQLPPQVLQSQSQLQVSQSQLQLQVSQSQLPPQVLQSQLPPPVSQSQLPPQVLQSQLPPQVSQSQLPQQVSQSQLPQVSQSQLPPPVSQSLLPPQVSQSQLPPQVLAQIELPPQVSPQIQLPPQVSTRSQLPQSPPILSPLGSDDSIVTDIIETENIPLPPEPQIIDPPLPPEPEVTAKEEPEVNEVKAEVTVEKIEEKELPVKSEEDSKGEEDAEDSIPLKQMIREETLRTIREERITEDTHAETDDDTPMELSREEEKDGKKKRDYSRKKKPDSRPCSGSESAAEASAPDSPGGDAEIDHRLWKKSVMLVYSRLCAHKYASVFLRPISDEEAPGYSAVVRHPMDLSTIRRNIDSGRMRTTAQFQRDLLLMLSNALMYNSSEHSVYTMAKEMHEEAVSELGILVCAQAHAALGAPPARRKRRRPDEHNVYKRQH